MDEIDLKLFELISKNPRCSYRDMADELSISTPAVHRRIQAAREQKILIGPIAMLNKDFAKAVSLVIWGKTEARNLDEVMEAIKDDDCSQIVTLMSGNNLLFRSILKDLNDLDRYVSFIRKAAKMPDLIIGLSPIGVNVPKNDRNIKLTKVDFKIMSALCKDGRMSVSEISEMINVSPKTVRNHLKKILDEKIIELMIIMNQAHSGNFVPFIVMNLEKDADKTKIMLEMKNNLSPPIIDTWKFSNQLDMLVTFAWVENMAQLRDVLTDLEKLDGVNNIVADIFVQSCGNCTWLETIISDPEKAMEFLKDKKII